MAEISHHYNRKCRFHIGDWMEWPVSLGKKSVSWILEELGCRHGNEVSCTTDVCMNLCYKGLSVFRGTLTFFMAIAAHSPSSIRETALWDFHLPSPSTTSARHISGHMSLGMGPAISSTDAFSLDRQPTTISSFTLYTQIFFWTNRIPLPSFEKDATIIAHTPKPWINTIQLFLENHAWDPGPLLFLPGGPLLISRKIPVFSLMSDFFTNSIPHITNFI